MATIIAINNSFLLCELLTCEVNSRSMRTYLCFEFFSFIQFSWLSLSLDVTFSNFLVNHCCHRLEPRAYCIQLSWLCYSFDGQSRFHCLKSFNQLLLAEGWTRDYDLIDTIALYGLYVWIITNQEACSHAPQYSVAAFSCFILSNLWNGSVFFVP